MDSECVFQRGSNFNYVFSWYHYKRAIIVPLAKRHLNCVSLAGRWPITECLVALWFYRGSRPILLRNPIFCDFSGGPDPLSPLWIRTWVLDPYLVKFTCIFHIKLFFSKLLFFLMQTGIKKGFLMTRFNFISNLILCFYILKMYSPHDI